MIPGQQLFLYCERLGPELLAEPLNALSNLAFFFGAWALWRQADREPAPIKAALRALAGMMALVGAGSLAFHTLATVWARLLDLGFIGLFNLLYLALFLWLVPRWPWPRTLLAVACFLALDRLAAMGGLGNVMNGSGTYLPAITALIALTAYAYLIAPGAGRLMADATGVFLLSLTARTMDMAVCSHWPWGTHFVWHVLNAWVLYQLSQALPVGRRATGDRPAMADGRPGS